MNAQLSPESLRNGICSLIIMESRDERQCRAAQLLLEVLEGASLVRMTEIVQELILLFEADTEDAVVTDILEEVLGRAVDLISALQGGG